MIHKRPLRHATLFAIALLFTTHFASACTDSTTMSTAAMPTITYPETKRVDVVEEAFRTDDRRPLSLAGKRRSQR